MADSVPARSQDIAPPQGTVVKAIRRRVLQHDLDMYAAISGRRPTVLPQEQPPPTALAPATGAWSPLVLCGYLRQVYHRRVGMYVRRPHLGEFFQKLSGQACERLREAQTRVAAAQESKLRRARAHDGESTN